MSAPPPPAGDASSFHENTGLTHANNAKLQQLLGFESGALEAHKARGGVCPFMQLQSGMSYMDDDNSLKAGARGPSVLEDQIHREKINHFDHERIPERVVHARGTGAHGFFQMTESLSDLSCAKVFADPSVKTPVFVRFSTVGGSRGSADTVRDVRGFAVKFYTSEGNWDLVGNNIPVFFVQDSMKFPDLIHSAKPEPQTEMPQAQTAHDNFWDFVSWSPETLHTLFWAMSDRGIPRSYRMMQGFGVHSFVLVNAAGKRTFFKAHWRPRLGVHGLAWDECLKLNGVDPDFHRRDLYDNIAAGNFPEYDFGVQCVAEEDEEKFDFDILDATKIIPEELVPIRWCGKLTLDRLPTDFFAEVEQVAFCTSNIVPGIDFSNDPLLQGRNFSYLDTQLSRLGSVNFAQIPINRPLHKPQNNQRDGHMQMNVATDKLNYFPNRNTAKGAGPRPGNGGESQGALHKHASAAEAFVSSAARVAGIKERLKAPKFFERVNQVRLFYNSQTAAEKKHICAAMSFELSKVDDAGVRERVVALVNEIDSALAGEIAANSATAAPGAPKTQNDGRQSKFLSMVTSPYSPPTTCATRKVAALLADGYKAAELVALKQALEKEGAVLVPVGVRRGKLFAEGEKVVPPQKQPTADPINDKPDPSGKTVEPPFTLVNSKSVLFDALVLIGGAAHVTTLENNGAAQAWIAETLKHCKAVGAAAEAVKLLAYPAGVAGLQISGAEGKLVVDDGVVTAGAASAEFAQAFVGELKKHRAWDRKNVDKLPA